MQGVELKLTRVHGVGIYGWGSVGEMAIGEWLEDISQNQVSPENLRVLRIGVIL